MFACFLQLDPYEGRLLILQFMEPLEAAAWQAQQEAKTPYLTQAVKPGSQAVLSPEALLKALPPQVSDMASNQGQEIVGGVIGGAGEGDGCSAWKGLVAAAEERSKRLAQQVGNLTLSLQQLRQQQQSGLATATAAARASGLGTQNLLKGGSLVNGLVEAGAAGDSLPAAAAPAGGGGGGGGRLGEEAEREEMTVAPTVVLLVVTNVFWLCMVVLLGCWILQRRPRKSDRYLY